MLKNWLSLSLSTLALASAQGAAEPALWVPRVFSHNAVLQRSDRVPVWGRALAGAPVDVACAGQQAQTRAGADGKWAVRLNLSAAAQGPFDLSIRSGSDRCTLTNILIGEVWLCSGQSNMRFHLSRATGGEAEAAGANDPELRLLNVGLQASDKPAADIRERWAVCTPETAGSFSAVGYYVGSELRKRLKVPVGVICASWAGTCIEAWMPRATLESDEDFTPILKRWDKKVADFPAQKAAFETNKVALMAAWSEACAKARKESRPEPLKPGPGAGYPGSLDTPSGMYNGSILPVAPYALRGVVWYQGEQNGGRGYQYRKLLPALIRDWRRLWDRGDFPFVVVQLPNFGKVQDQPRFSLWADTREAQALAAASVTNTYLAVSIDLGEDADVHPKEKRTLGLRVARIVEKEVYALPVKGNIYGPTYTRMSVEPGGIRIFFDHAQGLMTSDAKALSGFAVAGADKNFVWADAVIEGDTVLARSPNVKEPVAVRYNWADAPHGNLRNADKHPAAPFRTDDFKPPTFGNR